MRWHLVQAAVQTAMLTVLNPYWHALEMKMCLRAAVLDNLMLCPSLSVHAESNTAKHRIFSLSLQKGKTSLCTSPCNKQSPALTVTCGLGLSVVREWMRPVWHRELMKSSAATWKWRSDIWSSQSPMKQSQFTWGDLSHGVLEWEHQTLQQMVKSRAITAALWVPRYLYNTDAGLLLLNAANCHTGNLFVPGTIAFEVWWKKQASLPNLWLLHE